jgi:hypothetical protein
MGKFSAKTIKKGHLIGFWNSFDISTVVVVFFVSLELLSKIWLCNFGKKCHILIRKCLAKLSKKVT